MTNRRPVVIIDLHVEAFGGEADETLGVDRDLRESMTPQERSDYASRAVDDMMANHVAAGWHITDPDDLASTEVA